MPEINGSTILLQINVGTPGSPTYETLGSQSNVTFEETTEEIDVSSKDSRNFKGLPGAYKATFTAEAFFVPSETRYAKLKDAMRTGATLKVQRQYAGSPVESADCIITSLSEGFPREGAATVSISGTVVGAWA